MDPRLSVKLDRTVGRQVYRVHRWLYETTGGRIGHSTPTGPILLLTTTGRRSGQPRTTPLLYLARGDDLVVVASNGGRDDHPAWYLNVTADPTARVQVGAERFDVSAEAADAEKRAELWPELTRHYAGWAHYETLTDRSLPVVILHPVGTKGD